MNFVISVEVVCIAIAALFWGAYPLVARASGIGGAMGALILTLSGLVPISIAVIWQGGITKPATADLGKLIIAGMMMGIGLVAFNMVANSKRIDASISIPVIDTAMLIVTVIGAALFFSESMTAQKVIGIALLLAGIVVLRPA